jgi:Cdc6-like AAA superfamily ATPase
MENFMSNSTSTFNFSPRPEAHPMKWADLQPPVQKAVRDLLLRIEGATRAVKAKETTAVKAKETTANCFLVYGDRGTGKTTVLLTAKDACDPQKNIFGEDEDKEDAVVDQVITLLCERGRVLYSMLKQQFGLNDKKLDELKIELIQHRRLATDEHGTELVWVVDDERLKTEILKDARLTAERFTVGRLTADARNSAKELKNYAVWLDVLDLEPLPSRANLLTTVLTRVRNALDLSGSDQQTSEASSILEESVKSSRHQLTQLINDATLMWEDISEPDTRNRANRQVAAADIYARFQKRFHEADGVAEQAPVVRSYCLSTTSIAAPSTSIAL